MHTKIATQRHPSSFTVDLYSLDYKNLSRHDRVRHILHKVYYLTSSSITLGVHPNINPLDNGWKNQRSFHIGADVFAKNKKWLKAMKRLVGCKQWDIIIAMLLRDASICLTDRGRFLTETISTMDEKRSYDVLACYGISKHEYASIVDTVSKILIDEFGLDAKNLDPYMLYKPTEKSIFDLWLLVIPDPIHQKVRFLVSEHYISYKSLNRSFIIPLQATTDDPFWYVLIERFTRIDEKENFYRWIEQAFEMNFLSQVIRKKDGRYELYMITTNDIHTQLWKSPFYNIIKNICNESQREYLQTSLYKINWLLTHKFLRIPFPECFN